MNCPACNSPHTYTPKQDSLGVSHNIICYACGKAHAVYDDGRTVQVNDNHVRVAADKLPGLRNGMDGIYLCFTLGHDESDALARYVKRFGKQPEKTLLDDMLRLGPVK